MHGFTRIGWKPDDVFDQLLKFSFPTSFPVPVFRKYPIDIPSWSELEHIGKESIVAFICAERWLIELTTLVKPGVND